MTYMHWIIGSIVISVVALAFTEWQADKVRNSREWKAKEWK